MKNRKGRREEGLPASCSAQPARPATGPASHRPAPPTRCSQPAAWLARPSLRPSVARAPVSLACGRCHLGPACQPHVAHARASPRLRLQPLPAGPRTSALLCFFPTPRSNHRATEPRQQWQGGPGVMPGAWSCLPLAPRPRNPAHTVGCKLAPRSPLNSQPPITGLADPRSAIRASAESPSACPVARRHLVAVHSTPSQERGGRRGRKERKKAPKPPRRRRSSEPKTVPVLRH